MLFLSIALLCVQTEGGRSIQIAEETQNDTLDTLLKAKSSKVSHDVKHLYVGTSCLFKRAAITCLEDIIELELQKVTCLVNKRRKKRLNTLNAKKKKKSG